ncbi:pentapeptide repeat-containing protein [Stappia sp. ICDLI1TA098]
MAEDTPPTHAPEPPARDTSLKAPEALVWGGFLGIAAVGLVALATSGAEIWTRDYWGGNRSEILRNLGLLTLAVPALWLAWRRTNTASRQAETANRQQRVAERGLNVDRYQKGALMLESKELSVRIAGIYGLRELAISDPEESYIIVQSLLFAFIREKSRERALKQPEAADEAEGAAEEHKASENLGPDVQEALTAATALPKAIPGGRQLEAEAKWSPSLASANLSGVRLVGATLPGANLAQTNLSDAFLAKINLSGADLYGANLSGARLFNANLSRARLARANLSDAGLDGANLSGARLAWANLSDAGLAETNLSGARLRRANLSGADLYRANLSGARLRRANLSGADLAEANLSGADLAEANLSTADLEDVLIDEHTKLTAIWAWTDRPPKNMPPEIETAIKYRDPAERKDDD